MREHSRLVLPPRDLASCVAACIVRDTRGAVLSDVDRLNYFPASPLFSVTLTLQGQLHVSDTITSIDELQNVPPAANWLVEDPKNTPFCSWSPGPLFAVTIGFFPDAWQRLGGTFAGDLPQDMAAALRTLETELSGHDWPGFWHALSALWAQAGGADWAGSHRLVDWTRHLGHRLAHSGSGRSLRTAQRRLQSWTGQNRKTLTLFARIEDLHRLSVAAPDATPADLAADAGFSDQSHMGRALKRVTGFSPADLNQRVATEEAFWCYRLLGERF